jgi:adenylate cyclase
MTAWSSISSALASPRFRGGLLAIAAGLGVMALDAPPQAWLRAQLFDAYQRLLPRPRLSEPAVVVAIDERSLAELGQWPWPRNQLASLIDRVAAARPAAIGVDILWPEPDRLSPRRIVESVPGLDPEIARRAGTLPDTDATLAAALANRPVVLGMAGEATVPAVDARRPILAAPVLVRGPAEGLQAVPHYAGIVRSRPEMEAAAAGQGLINAGPDSVVRRVPLLGRAGERLLVTLELEMLRVAAGLAFIEVHVGEDGVRQVVLGDVRIRTDPDGAVWVRYGVADGSRLVSAADVLRGAAGERLRQKLVLLAPTGLGLVDQPATALGVRVPGVLIRAQLLENIFEGSWLYRPRWAATVEGALFALLALVYLGAVPQRAPRSAFVLLAATLLATGLGGLIAFNGGVLVDVASPTVAAVLVFTLALGATLAETQRQRRELAQRLSVEREAAARMAAELETARRVQMGMLPESPGVLAGDARVDLRALMEPARTVGGDLYDFFMLDERRLFVMIGDVSGKGLGAAMFMALIKSLCRGAVLREPDALDRALARAEAEILRENPESLFVTLLVLALDLDSGELVYCNAGHDPVYALRPGEALRKLDQGGRPPLCVLEGFPYPLGREQLVPGERLCLVTDGITEAHDRAGKLYGHRRLEEVLGGLGAATPEEMVEAVRRDVADFAGGAEQADDLSVLALAWRPETSGR